MADIPGILKQALRERRVIPFIGAGLSRNVKDRESKSLFPDWPTLLRNTIERLKVEGKEAKANRVSGALDDHPPDYFEAAKHARDGLGADWYDYLKQVFERSRDEVDDESLKLAKLCWQLGSDLLITGNYDDVLRWGCPKQDDLKMWNIEAVKEQVDLLKNNASTRFPTVWHLHGYIGDVHNLILTPDGYAEFYSQKNEAGIKQKYQAALAILKNLLTIRPFLFIGFSMDDKQFESQLRFISELYQGTSVKHYILLQKDEAARFEPRDYLEPVTFEQFDDLPSILEEMGALAAENRGEAPPKPPSGESKVPFNVPFRSKAEEFIGRDGKPEEIRAKLCDSGGVAIGQAVGIEGMGGLGKTQLAVEYAHKYRAEYPNGVIWFTADGDMEGQLRLMALESNWVNEFDKPENQLIVARQKLKNLNDALIIFDNVEKFEALEPYLPKTNTNSHILATSRYPIAEFDVLNIDILGTDDSIALLTATARRTPSAEDAAAIKNIVRDLDGLPLALEIAGAYLRMKPAISYGKYYELLENRIAQALPAKLARAGFTKHEQDVFQTLSISEEIFNESPHLKEVVDLLAWSGSSAMGLSLMAAMLGLEEIDLEDALGLGVSLSLLKKDTENERYSIHRLLAKVRRAEIPLAERKEWVGECVERLGEWFTSIREDFTRLSDFESELEHLEAWEKNATEDFPEKIVRLTFLKAYPAYYRGMYRNAEKWTKGAYRQYEDRKLDEGVLLADILNDLGFLAGNRGAISETLEFYQKVLNIREEILGKKHLDYATALDNMGTTYNHMGNHKKALELQQQALEIRREVGEKHPNYASSLNNVGFTYGELGNHKKALELNQQALEIRREVLGEKHPDYAVSLNNVGMAYDGMGNHKKALELKQQANEIVRQVLGEKHPGYAASLSGIGTTYDGMGNHKKALELKRQALEITREVLEEKHPDYAFSLSNIGLTYLRMKDAATAKIYLEQAHSIMSETFGPVHPKTLITKNLLAAAMIAVGGKEEAMRVQVAKRKKKARKKR